MSEGQEYEWHIELDYLYNKVRWAKEILGRGGVDCADQANKEPEPGRRRHQELRDITKGESK